MGVEISELVAAVATVATGGNLEVLRRDPLVARIDGPDGPIGLQVFTSGPVGVAVVELFMPVAKVAATGPIDGWIARASSRLFNVHVEVRDLEDVSVVEARSSIVAEGLSVEVLDRCLALLVVGARIVAGELNDMAGAAGTAGSAPSIAGHAGDMSAQAPAVPASASPPSVGRAAPVLSAGYL